MTNHPAFYILPQRGTTNTKALASFCDIVKAFASTAPRRQPSNMTLQLPTHGVVLSPPPVVPFPLVSVLVTDPCHLLLLKTSRTRRAPSLLVQRQRNVVRQTLHHRHSRLSRSRLSLSMVEVTFSAPQALIPLIFLCTSAAPRLHSMTFVSSSASVYEHAMDCLIYISPSQFPNKVTLFENARCYDILRLLLKKCNLRSSPARCRSPLRLRRKDTAGPFDIFSCRL
ncbi:hypothetical protein BDN70DRAFT_938791 [Pholiota conissans]|uniref:Uncharacterized protein n=1 Tax=Pholiota conissans TaxID=109636 RepID=A0A9P6CT17_9AGAR|nr:hypothetical protein BDN70DRAFT_938791 [Pholiota conissans]